MFEWLKGKTKGGVVKINSMGSGDSRQKEVTVNVMHAFESTREQCRIKDIENRMEFLEADLRVEHVSKPKSWFPGEIILRAHVDKNGMLILRKANKQFTLSKDEAAALNSLLLKWE